MSSSSSLRSHDEQAPDEQHWAFQLILEDQHEGLEAFRRRHERRQRRMERDLKQSQLLEAGGGQPTQKWKEMEKQQLQEEIFIRQQLEQRKEVEIMKQQQEERQQQQQPIRALSSFLHPSRSISLYPSTEDVSAPNTTPALQRHRSESWVLTRTRDSSSSLGCGDPPTSPFEPRPTRPIGWTTVDEEGCLVLESATCSSSLQAVLLPSSSSMQQPREHAHPPIARSGRRPGGPDLCVDDGVTRAPPRSYATRTQPLPPSPPPNPNRTTMQTTSSQPTTVFSRSSSSPLQTIRPSHLSSSQQEKLYRKIVPIFPQVPAERILQLVREQQELQRGDEQDEERRLSTILSILAEESVPLPEDELSGLDVTNAAATNKRECQCCYSEWNESDCPMMISCTGSLHVFCLDCVKKYVQEVVYGNLPIPETAHAADEVAWVLPCMFANTAISNDIHSYNGNASAENNDLCRYGLDDLILQQILPTTLWQPYQEYQVRRALMSISNSSTHDSDERLNGNTNDEKLQHCPHCGVPCLVSMSVSSQTMACPSCGRESRWTAATTPDGATVPTPPTSAPQTNMVETATEVEDAGRHYVEEAMTQTMLRNCPRCLRPFVKESGCHKMKCPMCRTASCYVCRQVVQWKGYDHFCTHEQHNVGIGCLECGPKCPLWSSQSQENPARPISQSHASSRTRRGVRRMDIPQLPDGPQTNPGLATGTFGTSADREEEEEVRRQAAWEAAQEVWEQNLLTTGQEIRVDIEELVRMPPSPPPAGLGPRQWTR
jgi:hypothetical protein